MPIKIKLAFWIVPLIAPLLGGCISQPVIAEGRANYRESWHVESEPRGAKVYLDEKYMGVTPLDFDVIWGSVRFNENGVGLTHTIWERQAHLICSTANMPKGGYNFFDNQTQINGLAARVDAQFPISYVSSMKIEAVKDGYEPSTRLIQLSENDETVNKAFQGITTGILYSKMAENGNVLDIFANARPTDISGTRSVLMKLSAAATGSSQQPQQQQQQQTVVVNGDSSGNKRGTVLVTSTLENTEVYADGIFVGNSPANLKLEPGIHIIEVKADGYKSYRKEVRVFADSETILKTQLEK